MKPSNPHAGRSIQLNPLAHWGVNHSRSLLASIGSITKRPISSFIAMLIIGIAIALPAGLHLFLKNLQQMTQQFQTTPTVSLYLQPNTSKQQAASLIQQIKHYQQVQQATFVSSEQGLHDFTQQTNLSEVVQQLAKNPLPAVIEVTPKVTQQNPAALKTLQSQLQRLDGVQMAQLDSQWVTRLYNIVLIGKRLSLILTLLFYSAVILIIGNTIRMTALNYQQESKVLRLFGASAAMVRRPLLYRGICFGLSGGALAWIIVELSMLYIKNPALSLTQSYQTPLFITHVPLLSGISLLMSGSLLGWLGAWIAAKHHLKIKE
jgi:cell division transport system permease protein